MTPDQIKQRIEAQKAYMQNREISNGRYYTDPYGYKADMRDLAELHDALKEAEAKPAMSDLGQSIFDMMTAINTACVMQAKVEG